MTGATVAPSLEVAERISMEMPSFVTSVKELDPWCLCFGDDMTFVSLNSLPGPKRASNAGRRMRPLAAPKTQIIRKM